MHTEDAALSRRDKFTCLENGVNLDLEQGSIFILYQRVSHVVRCQNEQAREQFGTLRATINAAAQADKPCTKAASRRQQGILLPSKIRQLALQAPILLFFCCYCIVTGLAQRFTAAEVLPDG